MVATALAMAAGLGLSGLGAYQQFQGSEKARKEYKKARDLLMRLQDPKYDTRELKQPELRVLKEFVPEVYQAVIETGVSLPEDSQQGRDAQQQSLQFLQQIQQQGLPLEQRLAAERSQRALSEEQRRAQQAVLQDLQQRGRAGGGLELQQRMAASQQGANLARDMGQDLIRQALQQQVQAAMSAGQLGGQLRGQDIQLSGMRSDALNRFNEWVSAMKTQESMNAAEQQNRAAMYNQQLAQQLANANEQARYSTQRENLDRYNMLEQQRKNFELNRLGAQANATNQYGDILAANAAAQGQMYGQLGSALTGLGMNMYSNQQTQPLRDAQIDYYRSLAARPTGKFV